MTGPAVVLSHRVRSRSVAVEERRPCLLLTFQLESHIVTPVDTLHQLLEADQYDLSKYLVDNAEYGGASVVTVVPLALVLV